MNLLSVRGKKKSGTLNSFPSVIVKKDKTQESAQACVGPMVYNEDLVFYIMNLK